MLFESPVPLNMRLRMQPRSLLTKWPVFLQNTFGNPSADRVNIWIYFYILRELNPETPESGSMTGHFPPALS